MYYNLISLAETIDGKWELTKQKLADGTVLKGDDVESYECYDIAAYLKTAQTVVTEIYCVLCS